MKGRTWISLSDAYLKINDEIKKIDADLRNPEALLDEDDIQNTLDKIKLELESSENKSPSMNEIKIPAHERKKAVLIELQRFLFKINSQINSILEIQRKWLISERYPETSGWLHKGPRTQEALLREAEEVHKKTLGLTYLTVSKLKTEIENFKQWDSPLKNHLLAVCQSTLNKVKAQATFELIDIAAKTKDKKDISIPMIKNITLREDKNRDFNKFDYKKYLSENGIRFVPFNQTVDPLLGPEQSKSDIAAACYGYTRKYSAEVRVKGKMLKLPRFDVGVLSSQRDQNIDLLLSQEQYQSEANKFSYDPDASLDFGSPDYEEMLSEAINNLNPGFTYLLSYYSQRSGHAMALRRIPNTSEIEFFDPNLGTVVFENEDQCLEFLCPYLKDYYDLINHNFSLAPMDRQPTNAVASIASFEKKAEVTATQAHLLKPFLVSETPTHTPNVEAVTPAVGDGRDSKEGENSKDKAHDPKEEDASKLRRGRI